MSNLNKMIRKPWNQKADPKPWNPKDESGKPFANARRHDEKFIHSTKWRNLRAFYFNRHPLCEECQRKGLTTKGYVVDHIIPRSQGGRQLDMDNLQTLCKTCHTSKTNKEISKRSKHYE